MKRRFRRDFTWFNEQREKRGLAPISRRQFLRLTATSSAAFYVPWAVACDDSGKSSGSTGASGTNGEGAAGYSGGSPAASGSSAPYDTGGTQQAGGTSGGSGSTAPVTGGSGGAGGSPAGTGGSPAGTGGGPAGTGGGPVDSGAAGTSPTDSGTVTSMNKVAISRDADTITNVRTAIDLAGGLGEIKGGDVVVIKPNLVTAAPNTCTSVEFLRGLIQAVKSYSPSKIILAECTALGMDTTLWAQMAGYIDLCDQEGIEFAAWDTLPYVGYRDPKWQFIKEEKRVPEMLDPKAPQYHHFITAPILKNHQLCPYSSAVFTSCIKLFVGVIPFAAPGGRWTPEPDGIHDDFLGEQVAELHCIVPKKLINVIDATTCVPANGPTGASAGSAFPHSDATGPMVTVNAGLVIASKDMVACESLGLATLKYYAKELGVTDNPGVARYVNKSVWADAQIKRAGELGLGTADPQKIEIVDNNVDNIVGIKAEWV
ncbi:MAG: DUF362 domain-containing protein [Deltaproteobacteria bacterium]|nr:DUF362 domain-containing protein [Deltaproteobacteria bacterium]